MKALRVGIPKTSEIADGDIVEIEGVRYVAKKDRAGWRLLAAIQTRDGIRTEEKRVKELSCYAGHHDSC